MKLVYLQYFRVKIWVIANISDIQQTISAIKIHREPFQHWHEPLKHFFIFSSLIVQSNFEGNDKYFPIKPVVFEV